MLNKKLQDMILFSMRCNLHLMWISIELFNIQKRKIGETEKIKIQNDEAEADEIEVQKNEEQKRGHNKSF